ncbi:TVP38/TMEM64 family protein [Lysinibacillus piscis]|uniref:TVP38/TMEM64 family membrane protein n=1 Tax=Lysinibacillus piscis TaxID=2518931 RepID=A0ABQ5NHK5_9BACI|nr:TVP38/TMEM64 family protein [Lysinibacillus sp. KH24]GLC87764.1 putative membrane protein YhjE [Lysinibacillus sp. KH24]
MSNWFTVENMEQIVAHYRTFGPFMGILFPFLEAFLPFLPLVVFVVANASAFGLWIGFLLSWLGSAAGSYAVFLLVRRFGRHRKLHWLTGSKKVKTLIQWVDMNGLSPLFVLLCFPFTPSVLVNIVAGLSHIHKKFYLVVLLAGKFIMILGMSVLGYDLRSLLTSPVKLIMAAIAIVVLWWLGKLLEKRLNARVERDLRNSHKSKQM